MNAESTGVTYYEAERDCGPFRIRISGTRDFVSKIDPDWHRAVPPGKVDLVSGWDNENALTFPTMDEAIAAAKDVWNIEGFHTTIEGSAKP